MHLQDSILIHGISIADIKTGLHSYMHTSEYSAIDYSMLKNCKIFSEYPLINKIHMLY